MNKIILMSEEIKILFSKITDFCLSRLIFIVLFATSFILTLSIHCHAETADTAVINKVDSTGNTEFWMWNKSNDRNENSKKAPSSGGRIRNRGELSVPNDGTSASFHFEFNNNKTYAGLVIQAGPSWGNNKSPNIYRFPCEVKGRIIIAWKADNNKDRTCDAEGGGITVLEGNLLASSRKSDGIKNEYIGFKNKENRSQSGNQDLIIHPGKGQTVIRTNIEGATSIAGSIEKCEDIPGGLGRTISGPPKELTTRKCDKTLTNTSSEIISFEVLEGDLFVKKGDNTEGQTISKGQKYFYPQGKTEFIDTSKEANTCEMLRFLNAAYWSSPETPKKISDGIAEQLRQHREALGVSGRPPSSLSQLESSVFEEMNRLRKWSCKIIYRARIHKCLAAMTISAVPNI